jgi:hypothetical protein
MDTSSEAAKAPWKSFATDGMISFDKKGARATTDEEAKPQHTAKLVVSAGYR